MNKKMTRTIGPGMPIGIKDKLGKDIKEGDLVVAESTASSQPGWVKTAIMQVVYSDYFAGFGFWHGPKYDVVDPIRGYVSFREILIVGSIYSSNHPEVGTWPQ